MRQIVVALVPGEENGRVVDAAAELAEQTKAPLTVVAIDEVESQRFEPLPRSETLSRAEETANRAVERLAERGLTAEGRAVSGAGPAAVEAAAADLGADLIVVGTGSRGPIARRLLGDLALELVQSSQRQVLVVTDR
jgi:nucleotide-binding universal stress UspA family protein